MYHCNIQQFILVISEPYSHSILTTDPSADNYRLSTISALTTDTTHLSRTSSTIDNSSTSLAQVSDSDDTKPDIKCSNRSSILSVTDVIKSQQPLFSGIQSGIPQSQQSSDDNSPLPPPLTAPPPLDGTDSGKCSVTSDSIYACTRPLYL